mmetsp:Transcript_20730/g.29791  ORF Transcript_20730/g.29791 Transcript_20730/m.29791 type:complete len:650 (+) Transcript_20730:96-2045(+)|eukprot:CAMPEP_0185036794 /NCGR_PEP_ID=MMETSP1103-20130426/30263_1 /TAXON_ID=36769 /ORGANISM="Paraphysomonas bandaiensis, Strain Caron Lab Isolate" /LENGTH=649 /DNA_ID=CAMNT_0027574471 /DNA_START=75 /DNA_END=2024 /DNA_ORIENTATION=-
MLAKRSRRDIAVTKDVKGFDDIDLFWNATDTALSPSDTSTFVDEFAYDTSSTISEVSDDMSDDASIVEVESTAGDQVEVSRESDMSESLSLIDNNTTIPESQVGEDEDTDAQELSDADDLASSNEASPVKRRGGSSTNRRASAPAAIRGNKTQPVHQRAETKPSRQSKSPKKKSADDKDTSVSPFDAGRLSSIGVVGRRGSPEERVYVEAELEPDFGDDMDGGGYDFGHEDDDVGNESFAFHKNDTATKSTGKKRRQSSVTFDPESTSKRRDSTGSRKSLSSTATETPRPKKGQRRRVSYMSETSTTPGTNEFPRGRTLRDDSFTDDEDDDANTTRDIDSSGLSSSGYVDTSFMSAARRGLRDSDEEENDIPSDHDSADEQGLRRSRRATKGQRFQFWKNERSVYMRGRMVGLLRAEPTPRKPKRTTKQNNRGRKRSKVSRRLEDSSESEAEQEIHKTEKNLPPPKIPSDIKYIPRDGVTTYSVWDDDISAAADIKTISIKESMYPPAKLPISAPRPQGNDIVGLAAQSFNISSTARMSGWISGFVDLPPGAIKDAEGVGECCQVFVISDCQNGSVEFGLADPSTEEWDDETAQRSLLNKGDFFFVPPGNIYRLENHSSSKSCMIYWTIIRPVEDPENEEDEETKTTDE